MHFDLGAKIRQLRRRDERTQEVLAEALGVTSQAVSRWESGGSYPDMSLIPSIANYFGVTIDELFGYTNQRDSKINALVSQIQEGKRKSFGENGDIDGVIELARRALVEFPGNERIMVCLASALYAAGYQRHGEHHLTDLEGYDIYDTARHRNYSEWKEAIALYEKALVTMEDGDMRRVAVGELTQLYVNMGQYEKSLALAEAAPGIYSTREYMRIYACDGKERVQAQGSAILGMVHASAALVIQVVLAARQNITLEEKIRSIRDGIGMFDAVCCDGNYGDHNTLIARMYTQLALYLWMDGQSDAAFEALDRALVHFRQFEELCKIENPRYTAPLIRGLKMDFSRCTNPDPAEPGSTAVSLYKDFPWWHVEEEAQVREEMQADPRWQVWVEKCNASLA